MSILAVTGFTGEQPRIINRLLPATAAKSAIDCRMDDGGLVPFNAPSPAHTFPGTPNYQTIYRHGADWLGWTGTVHAVPGPVAADRLYYTGDGVPKMRVSGTVYDLKVAFPSTKPTLTPSGTGTGDVTVRQYAYTYVTGFGEESEPSPVSDPINWQSGITVTLSGLLAPPAGRNITLQRFYRTQTGPAGTDLYFVAERAASASNFVDNIAVDQFAEPLPSRTWNAPPDTLAGLIALPNGMMAAFVGKQLYFSEPYQPHAWPEIYVQTVDADIVGLGAMDMDIIVLTKAQPWRCTGTEPASMSMTKIELNLPCVSGRSIVDLGYAVTWAAPDGLAIARAGGGGVGLVSENLFNPRDWRALNPEGMRGGQYQRRWIGAYDALDENGDPITAALIIDVAGQISYLIRASVVARSWFYEIATSDLFYLDPDGKTVRLFDPEEGAPADYYWRSKDFFLGTEDNFGVILVETGEGYSAAEIAAKQAAIDAILAANQAKITAGTLAGAVDENPVNTLVVNGDTLQPVPAAAGGNISVGVYADDVRVATVGATDRPVRLPAGFRARQWGLDAFGDLPLDKITMARTMDELKQVPAS